MLKVTVGHSDDPDAESAIAEVLEQCQGTLDGLKPQAGLLFAGIDFEHQILLDRIHDVFPNLQLIGGTTDGEMSSVLGFQQDSVALMLFCSDTVEMAIGLGRDADHEPEQAVQDAIAQAQAQLTQPPKLCLAFPEGLDVNQSRIVEALKQSLQDENVPIFGAFTGDQYVMEKTYQFYQRQVLQKTIPILLLSGNLIFSSGVSSGWQPVGKKSYATRVEENIVYEIDGQTALSYYRQYLGGLDPNGEYPLAIFEDESGLFYLRSPIRHDPETGSITFLGNIPEKVPVQITEARRDSILSASRSALAQALKHYPHQKPDVALFFSCAARRWFLGTRVKEEYELVKKSVPAQVPCCGFYGYGEIAPLESWSETRLHNETFVAFVLGTAED